MYQRPHWSYSSITQYLACPLRYYFQRVLCIPQPSISSSLALGSTVHAVLAEYHLSIQLESPKKSEDLHRFFSENWENRMNHSNVAFKVGETPNEVIDQGIALMELYLKEPPPEKIVSIEREIISPVHNSRGEYLETPLVAIADLITQENEALKVQEFKTAARAYAEIESETSLQPTCYVNAVQEVYDSPVLVEYTVLIKTKTPKLQRLTAERTDEDLGRLGDIIENIERAVQANIFYPVENPINCSTCTYRKQCRQWGRGFCEPAEDSIRLRPLTSEEA